MFKLLTCANQKKIKNLIFSSFWGWGDKPFQIVTKDGDRKFISCLFFLYKLTATIIPLSIIKI